MINPCLSAGRDLTFEFWIFKFYFMFDDTKNQNKDDGESISPEAATVKNDGQSGDKGVFNEPTNEIPKEGINQRLERLQKEGGSRKGNKGMVLTIVLFLLVAGGVTAGFIYRSEISNFLGLGKVEEAACTADAKQCPDGSYVGRVAPDCEFAECVTVETMSDCEKAGGGIKDIIECDDSVSRVCELSKDEACYVENLIDGKCEGEFSPKVLCDSEEIDEEVDTSDWQTYRNEEVGFKIMYPEIWEFSEGVPPVSESALIGSIGPIGIIVVDKELESDNIQGIYGRVDDERIEIVKVDGENGYMFRDGDAGCGGNIVQIPNNKKIIQLGFIDCDTDTQAEDFRSAMLSTFKFLKDSDSDGLHDDKETEYGTDINNPDSDGDGYLDGEEVKGGYNPMGPGRLMN